MQISEYKNLYNNFNSSTDLDFSEFREFLTNVDNSEIDFEIGNYRFINKDNIDEIQCEELESDAYILGCFNASFLSGIIELDQDIIETLQSAEKYESLGEYILKHDYLNDVQQEYMSLDGYGHYFGRYDGNEYTISILDETNGIDETYYIFRVN